MIPTDAEGFTAALQKCLFLYLTEDHEEKRVLEETNKHLLSYALRGLRTLCMARKVRKLYALSKINVSPH